MVTIHDTHLGRLINDTGLSMKQLVERVGMSYHGLRLCIIENRLPLDRFRKARLLKVLGITEREFLGK